MEFLNLVGIVTVKDLVAVVVIVVGVIFMAGYVRGIQHKDEHFSSTYRPMPPTQYRRRK